MTMLLVHEINDVAEITIVEYSLPKNSSMSISLRGYAIRWSIIRKAFSPGTTELLSSRIVLWIEDASHVWGSETVHNMILRCSCRLWHLSPLLCRLVGYSIRQSTKFWWKQCIILLSSLAASLQQAAWSLSTGKICILYSDMIGSYDPEHFYLAIGV